VAKLCPAKLTPRRGLAPERALASLASAVQHLALADALQGDDEAQGWITDPQAIEVWAWAAGFDPAWWPPVQLGSYARRPNT